MLTKNRFFIKVQFCRRFSQKLTKNSHRKFKVTKNPENSSQKLKGAANPFVLFADSWSNF